MATQKTNQTIEKTETSPATDKSKGSAAPPAIELSTFEKLSAVQYKISVPKNQRNNFGKFNYRSCEDIMEALKPITYALRAVVYMSDRIVEIGPRFYVEATAHFVNIDNGEEITNVAYARESDDKAGMDGAQVTGASSSYARKYALAGLFALDDNKDADSDAMTEQRNIAAQAKPAGSQARPASGKSARNDPPPMDELPPPASDYDVYPDMAPQAPPVEQGSVPVGVVCSQCGTAIESQKVIDYSMKKYGQPLCFKCQKEYI